MAQVEFHTGVADSIGFACRLLRKAYRQGQRVAVSAPESTLGRLDRSLWTFDERDFVPHLRLGTGPLDGAQLRRTPIWLLAPGAPALADSPPVQVNLGAELPAELPALTRLIEIVSADDAEAHAARERWRSYKAHGHTVIHHGAGAST
jgi:DNA polymerase-3 subunit chi